jgi:AraC family transcriptional regulator
MDPILSPGQFYGDRQKSLSAGSFRFTESYYSPAYRIPRHSHAGAFFGFVAEGAYSEHYDSKYRDCVPGCLVFHPAGETHSEDHADVTVRIFSIEPRARLLDEVHEISGGLRDPLELRASSLIRLARRLYQEFLAQDSLAPLAMEGLAFELLAECGRENVRLDSRPPGWLARARDFLHNRAAERWTLEGVARDVGVHPVHLAREFRRHFRCTPGDYVRQERVDLACQALRDSDEPLAQIAIEAGFSHQAHFTRVFKQVVGVTPAVYRDRNRAR